MRSTEIGSLDFTTLASTLLVFNAAGAASALRVARLERQRFATREAELRTLAQLTAQSHELANARDEADHANRAKSEFLAHMSHELRTPLNAINGFSEVIKDELFGPAPPRYRDYAADIHRSGMHLTALINDILDLSKVEAGKLEIHDEIVAPEQVAEACFRLLKDRAFKARLSLHSLVPADAPRLRADGRLVKQILLNLLTNAIKFTPAGGEVRVIGRGLPNGAFALAVEDTGVGIAAEDIPRVLEPYGQVGTVRRHNPEGTGLGLPLVKRMIELHGGTLALESTPGVGTVATVTFPAARVTAPDDRATAAPLAKAS
jgi:signal transduction histidine kinase